MTFLDMIEMYNVTRGNELDDLEAMFSDIVLDQRLDKSTLIGVLLDHCGAMDCIYETTDTFKYFSNNFFKKYEWNITKLCDTLSFQYDPLKTKNIEWTETTSIEQNLDTEEDRTRANTGTQGTSFTDTKNNTHSDTDRNSYEDTQTNTISAMNSSSYEPDNKRDTSGSGSTTNTGNYTETDTGSNTRTDNLSERINATKGEDLNWNETDTHTESGTDGTPYQDLIQKERRQAEYNIYNWIAEKYAHELFLLVY